jgi:hypothetical protein
MTFIVEDVGGGPFVRLADDASPASGYRLTIQEGEVFVITRPNGTAVDVTGFYGDVDFSIGYELRLALRPTTTWADLLVSNHTKVLCDHFSLTKNRKVKAQLLAHAPWAEVKKAVAVVTEIRRIRVELELKRANTFVVAASELAVPD